VDIRGRVFKFSDNVNTDEIIPARYLNTTRADELARHCMEDIDKDFLKKMKKGDVIVAGKNFGCGSSREHAPISIKAAGISAVIAENFARIFYRNALNIGLPILESKEASRKITEGDLIEVDVAKGKIKNLSKKETYNATSFPPFMEELIAKGGLIPYLKDKLKTKKTGK
jgi:3-isopropylmalate/(R)-2-methylmalate dehydratase small subunit